MFMPTIVLEHVVAALSFVIDGGNFAIDGGFQNSLEKMFTQMIWSASYIIYNFSIIFTEVLGHCYFKYNFISSLYLYHWLVLFLRKYFGTNFCMNRKERGETEA